jgi:hypothetical protein
MATINLADKFDTKLDERYKQGSLTDRWCGTNYDWEGVNAIKIYTLDAGDLTDYNSTASANRFGTPSEVDDEVNTYALTKKRSFAKTFDVTHVQDQLFVKKATAYLKQMWDERYIPEIDTYRFLTWANGAGTVTINGTALTKATVIEALLNAHAALDDAAVPSENRVTFVRSDIVVACKLADELKYNSNYTGKAVIKGQVGVINDSPIVSVPKSRMPAGVEFMVKYKQASADPMKLRMLRANDNAPGIAGTLMEGLCRYDSFVLAQKTMGIYVYAQNGAVATPAGDNGTTVSGKVTLTCATSGATIKYTTDGTNPKTSATAATYSAAFDSPTSGSIVRAYASKSGNINSGIFELKIQ